MAVGIEPMPYKKMMNTLASVQPTVGIVKKFFFSVTSTLGSTVLLLTRFIKEVYIYIMMLLGYYVCFNFFVNCAGFKQMLIVLIKHKQIN